jgi:PAS domain S-box-containing protein
MTVPLVRYALCFAILAAAIALRFALDPILGDAFPLVTLFGAVAATVWLSGVRAGIAVSLAGYAACAYLFIPPRGGVHLDASGATGFAAYFFTCALIVGFGEKMRRAQNAARAEREVLSVTLRSIGDAVITTDTKGNVTYLNSVAEETTGWTVSEARGEPLDRVFRIVNEDTRAPVENPAHRALREGRVVGLANHTLLLRKDGTERPIDDSAAPIRDENGEVSGCVLVFRDVTEQRRLERNQAAELVTANRLAAIVESSDDAIVGKSLNGVIKEWNAAAERLFGYSADEAIGRHISLVIPPERIAEEDRIIAELKAGRRVEHFETERLRRDGRRISVSLTISPIKDASGNVIGASKIARDVTGKKALEQERQRFVTLVESSTDFIGISDLNGTPLFVNRAGLSKVGLDSLEAANATTVWEFFFDEDRERIRNELFPAVLRDGHGEMEIRFRHFVTGEAVWMAYKVVTLRDDEGTPVAFATVSQDISERKRMTDRLAKLAYDLTEADRKKNEFLATLAHELRNPLAPITGMLEVMKRSDGNTDTQERARDIIDRQVKQLVRLVDDLLDLNRVTHGRLELRPADVEVKAIVEDAVDASRPYLESARHRLHLDLPPEPVRLHVDPARLAQVLGNLINNSCKYTPNGGTIWVSVQKQAKELVLSVKDTGVGIPPEKQGAIFEMFTQLEPSPAGAPGGLGIGLTLVKQLVTMHGGTIEVRSGGTGQGSEFIVRLPLQDAGAPRAPEPAKISEFPAARCHRVLVVDDNLDAAETLQLLLELWGNEAHVAHDGQETLEAVQRLAPDIVLLDIGLPDMSGLEVCRRLRAQPGGKGLVLLALTGWGQEEDRRQSMAAGFDGHLVKPVNHDELQQLLQALPPKQVTPAASA